MSHTVGYTNSARFKCLEDLQKDSVDLCLTYCGWEHCYPSHRFGPNKREAYVLHIISEGKGILEMNRRKYELKKGDAFCIPPGIEAWYEADKEDPWCYMWIGFVGLKAEASINSAGFSMKNPVRTISCIQEANQYIEQMLESHQLSYGNELRRNGLLMLVISALIDDYHKNSSGGGNSIAYAYPGSVYVKHAAEYIAHHYNEKLRIHELAAFIGVNRSYLTSSFKKIKGCSPQEYLVNLRIEKAKSLLKGSDMSISAVANAVGYSDQLAFSKVFKQRCGQSPSSYKEEKGRLVVVAAKGDYERNSQL